MSSALELGYRGNGEARFQGAQPVWAGMTGTSTQRTISDDYAATLKAQHQASDPAASVWVSANAGTGKTHVLTRRVLRLLLAGTAPERILCLTYTKAAAAEMSARIFRELGDWVAHDNATLAVKLGDLLGHMPTEEQQERARTLFAFAIEAPGGLKVQTIHSFAERLLKRFPLEAGVAPGFAILDEITARGLLREAIDDMLADAMATPASALRDALDTAIAYAVDDGFDGVLGEALQRRDLLDHVFRTGDDPPDAGDDASAHIAAYCSELRRAFGLASDATRKSIKTALSTVLARGTLIGAFSLLHGGNAYESVTAAGLGAALNAQTPEQTIAGLRHALLTRQDQPKSERSLASAASRRTDPATCAALDAAAARFARLSADLRALDVIEATAALMRLADAVLQRYAHIKARRAALDYDDLIRHAARLLHGPAAAPWVLFKLDGGLDHILVDESQDTSPEQWRIVEALAGEFFSGTGTHAQPPTLFAVGDEKQSIYSFQGARPEQFARMGRTFRNSAVAGGALWRDIPLTLSFRTVAPVLDAVDTVFADPLRTPGLSTEAAVRHAAHRAGHSGLVEIWDTEKADHPPDDDVWSPVPAPAPARTPAPVAAAAPADAPVAAPSATVARTPAARLAGRIARRIKAMIDGGELLPSQGRPITAGDILILVRKRVPFAPVMVAALKELRIPVAGADRLSLTDQIAVKDLIVLGDFLTLPEDDLALATVLKSPMFGFDDELLQQIALDRRGASLWKAMLDRRALHPAIDAAADRLRDWRRRADFQPPYEFFAGILERDGVRRAMLERLGAEAADSLDELLTLAIQYDEGAPPSLTGFLAWLRQAQREVKRDMEQGRDEVRILTVHGAKGLEAPIVFLPDTCSGTAAGRRPALVEIDSPSPAVDAPAAIVWAIKKSSRLAPIAAGRGRRSDAESHELNRLLYVAMTRARDRLYIAGFEGRKGLPPGCWYDLVQSALKPSLHSATDAEGLPVRRLQTPQTAAPETNKSDLARTEPAVPHPDWAARKAPVEQRLSVPLAPSRLAPYDVDDAGDPVSAPPRAPAPGDEPAAASPRLLAGDNRFLRGTLTHTLLQHLPDMPEPWRRTIAQSFVAARGGVLPEAARRAIVTETLAVMSSPELAPLFGPASRAEVPIRAELPHPSGRGPSLRIAGQIDRLAICGQSVLIADYKTNHPAPREVVDVADAYIYQLAAYRLALAQMFPDKAVRAVIVWTEGPRLMAIPDELVAAYARQLWELDAARLDAE